jgi:hypothetical protein
MKFRKAAAALAFASLSVSVAAIGQVRSSSSSSMPTDEAAVEAYNSLDVVALTKMAQAGNAFAQGALGALYQRGRGVEMDVAAALSWFRKAADQGNSDAQGALGNMYAAGNGVAQDLAVAASWFRKSADQGNAAAQRRLGDMYADGKGVAQDNAAAVSWYRKSADQGNVNAQINLGVMYAEGAGVAQDYAQAYHWFSSAAGTTDPELRAKAASYQDIALSEMQKNTAPAAPPQATPANLTLKNAPASPAKNTNPGKPIFCEEWLGEDNPVRRKFTMRLGVIKFYGGGNAWEAPLSLPQGNPWQDDWNLPLNAKLSYGGGLYTISSPAIKDSFSFERGANGWEFYDNMILVYCDFDQ